MAQYIVRHRKGQSMRQKAHIRKLNQQCSQPGCKDPPAIIPASSSPGQLDVLTSPSPTATTTSILSRKNKYIIDLQKKCKNTKQREKRAKIKITDLKDCANQAYLQLSMACQATSDAEGALAHAKAEVDTSMGEILMLCSRVKVAEQQVSQVSYKLLCATREIEKQEKKALALNYRWMSVHRSQDALRKRIKRIQPPKPVTTNVKPQEYHLKDSTGVIHPVVRDMLRKLACKGVAAEHISDVINIVAEGLGVAVVGTVSARSVRRVMFEGLIQATMQIAHELQQAKSVSLCGDGTRIQNQQHESKSLYLQIPVQTGDTMTDKAQFSTAPASVLRTLGVRKAVSHTAHQQFEGWLNAFDRCFRMLTMSPLGQNYEITSRMVAPKLRGILTDHAADQKRLVELMAEWKKKCDREARVVSSLGAMTTEQQLSLLLSYLDSATMCIGDWRSQPAEKQSAILHDAWFALAFEIGESELRKLTPDVQFDVDFIAWAGCCMHKELNAVKGGVARMSKKWELLNLTPPLELKNKIEIEFGSQTIGAITSRGALKITRLSGSLFNHKDDEKGYQKVVDNYFQKIHGYSKRFPDVSNTRYGSYCDAAAELVLHQEDYLHLLERVRDGKSKPVFVNIEHNVYEGLQDTPTLTELVVLALYAQAIGRPYMRYVRGTVMFNALELGQFHSRVKSHCQAIAQNPEILLEKSSSFESAVLGGQPWDCLDVVSRARDLAPSLPHLREMLVAFFEGALDTWERFTSEFEPVGAIARATPEQRQSAWVPPTNDVSEGALGRCRQMLRRAPNMTDNQRNARVMWQDNHTIDWAKATLTDADDLWIRKEARLLDTSGEEKKLREQMDSALDERAAAGRDRLSKALTRKADKQLKLASVKLLKDATYEQLSSMRVKELDEQIDKLREVGDAHIRPKSMIGNKRAKIKELLAALEHYKSSTFGKLDLDNSENEIRPMEVEVNETFDYDDCPEDLELCYNNDLTF